MVVLSIPRDFFLEPVSFISLEVTFPNKGTEVLNPGVAAENDEDIAVLLLNKDDDWFNWSVSVVVDDTVA